MLRQRTDNLAAEGIVGASTSWEYLSGPWFLVKSTDLFKSVSVRALVSLGLLACGTFFSVLAHSCLILCLTLVLATATNVRFLRKYAQELREDLDQSRLRPLWGRCIWLCPRNPNMSWDPVDLCVILWVHGPCCYVLKAGPIDLNLPLLSMLLISPPVRCRLKIFVA